MEYYYQAQLPGYSLQTINKEPKRCNIKKPTNYSFTQETIQIDFTKKTHIKSLNFPRNNT